jgi:hypothetical protein
MRTLILCMPRCGSKFLQHVLTQHQRSAAKLLPGDGVQRHVSVCSLEEFTGFYLNPSNTQHATITDRNVTLTRQTYPDHRDELRDRLAIMRQLDNYVVKHFVWPDTYNTTKTVTLIADAVYVLHRKDVFEHALSIVVSKTLNNYWASPDVSKSTPAFIVSPQDFLSTLTAVRKFDDQLHAINGHHVFMEDLVALSDNRLRERLHLFGAGPIDRTFFGEEYGSSKTRLVANIEQLKDYASRIV